MEYFLLYLITVLLAAFVLTIQIVYTCDYSTATKEDLKVLAVISALWPVALVIMLLDLWHQAGIVSRLNSGW